MRRAALAVLVVLLVASGAAVTTAVLSDGDDTDEELVEFCTLAVDRSAIDAVFAGADPADAEDLLGRLDGAVALESELRRAAPAVVEDELDTLVRYLEDLRNAVRGGEMSLDEAAESLEGRAAEVGAASRVVRSFVSERC